MNNWTTLITTTHTFWGFEQNHHPTTSFWKVLQHKTFLPKAPSHQSQCPVQEQQGEVQWLPHGLTSPLVTLVRQSQATWQISNHTTQRESTKMCTCTRSPNTNNRCTSNPYYTATFSASFPSLFPLQRVENQRKRTSLAPQSRTSSTSKLKPFSAKLTCRWSVTSTIHCSVLTTHPYIHIELYVSIILIHDKHSCSWRSCW